MCVIILHVHDHVLLTALADADSFLQAHIDPSPIVIAPTQWFKKSCPTGSEHLWPENHNGRITGRQRQRIHRTAKQLHAMTTPKRHLRYIVTQQEWLLCWIPFPLSRRRLLISESRSRTEWRVDFPSRWLNLFHIYTSLFLQRCPASLWSLSPSWTPFALRYVTGLEGYIIRCDQ